MGCCLQGQTQWLFCQNWVTTYNESGLRDSDLSCDLAKYAPFMENGVWKCISQSTFWFLGKNKKFSKSVN